MRRGRFSLVLLLAGLAPAALWAQPDPSPTAPAAEEPPPSPDSDDGESKVKGRRSQHARALTKIRSESYLRRNREEVTVDLRGEYERRRDYELVRHFTRLAQLDVIAGVAEEIGDAQLASSVDAVRRSELERFRLTMLHLQRVVRTRLQTGLP